ncbi:type II toxin-antitoxin system VapC family toxin [Candidatus Woesebacteria bacterium]|nr:type II toxin-antitoxin system VapC family toxin [Candidatus Woesebacteria bacterium]
MEENIKQYIVDTSFVLSFLMPDEQSEEARMFFERYGRNEVALISTSLLEYEVANALWTNVLRKRITADEGEGLLSTFKLLQIPTLSVEMQDIFELSIKLDISCYDAAYVALAHEKNAKLLTYDTRLKKLVE